MFSVGLVAVLRSKQHKGKAIGVMITASHNPSEVTIRSFISISEKVNIDFESPF